MTTMLDVVTWGLRAVNIISSQETPSAADASDGTRLLNNMLHSWRIEGVDLNHQTLTQSQTLPYDDAYLEGIQYNLAARMGAEWGVPVPQYIIVRSGELFKTFQANNLEFPDDLHVDRALQPQHFSKRHYGSNYNIDEG